MRSDSDSGDVKHSTSDSSSSEEKMLLTPKEEVPEKVVLKPDPVVDQTENEQRMAEIKN